jgi:menaquinone-9 beta-reductase
VRAGLATYTGDSALQEDLVDFLGRHALGELPLDVALSRYRAYLSTRRRGYRVLDRLQDVLNVLPDPLFSLFARTIAHPRVLPWAVERYWRVADPDLLTPSRAAEPLPEPAAVA